LKKDIRHKLKKYWYQSTDTILLEVLQGQPRSKTGGVWIEVPVSELEAITEEIKKQPTKTERIMKAQQLGYAKYFTKWIKEGLLREEEIYGEES